MKLLSVFLILSSILSCSKKNNDPAPTGSNTSNCFYSFSQSTDTYTLLTSPDGHTSVDSLNNTIQLPFPIKLFGRSFNSIQRFGSDNIYFFDSPYTNGGTSADSFTVITLANLNLHDCAYKTTGVSGNRIFKMEFTYPSTSVYSNLQVWLYENSGNIDVRFGDVTMITGVFTTTISYNNGISKEQGVGLSGQWNSPVLNCFDNKYTSNPYTADNYELTGGNPQSGLIYSFTKLK
jgi:hypothetical protein